MDARRCARDSEGWRIPREGTKSRAVYDLARTLPPRSIARQLGLTRSTVGVLLHRIRNPEYSNAVRYQYQRKAMP